MALTFMAATACVSRPMTDKRKVTDILDDGSGPVAFNMIEHGHYSPVCPFCTQDIGVYVFAKTYGELYEKILMQQVLHMSHCEQREATEMSVEIRGAGVWQN